MSKRVLCKFFAHGGCLKGEHCEFSHEWKDPPNNVCTYYQKGMCSYGSRCRYEHVELSCHETSAPTSSSNSHPHMTLDSVQVAGLCGVPLNGEHRTTLSGPTDLSVFSQPFLPHGKLAWSHKLDSDTHADIIGDYDPLSINLAAHPLCFYAAAGNCPYGEVCTHIHGDLCSTCGKHILHPYRPEEREAHREFCEKNHKRLETLKLSREIECSVCLDRVLSKTKVAERKFGLLSECDHPFCISCIRNWRSNSPSSGMDVNTALRACPVCRKHSYFVIPSVLWYSTEEEKQEIIRSYKTKLKSIHCKYFDFGNGTCPFGASCFYRHAYRDGSLEEVVQRHLDEEDEDDMIAKDNRLSDFFSELHL